MRRAALLLALLSACTPICPRGDCPGDTGLIDRNDGWDDPWGRGRIYAISDIAIADEDEGFDLDGRCTGSACIDNRLSALSFLLNAQIQQEHIKGNGRTLLELAGAETITGDDPRATVKMYEAVDFTQPLETDDDFKDCAGCARFYVTERSILGDDARWKAPAKIEAGVIRNAGLGSLAFTLPLPQQTRVVPLEHATFEAEMTSELGTSLSILMGGAVAASELAMILEPGCVGANAPCRATLLDYLAGHGVQPDIDLDGDGFETFVFDPETRRIGACFDGCVEGCPHDLAIAPIDADQPWSCAFAGSVRDAYSLTLFLAATPAFIQGVR